MDILANLICFGWILPTILLVVHTLYCILFVLVTPRHKNIPISVGILSSLFINHVNYIQKYNVRPSTTELVFVLVGSIIPIVSLAILLTYISQFTIYVWYCIKGEV